MTHMSEKPLNPQKLEHKHSYSIYNDKKQVINTVLAPPCPACAAEADIWDRISTQPLTLAKKINRLESYKKYMQRYPFEGMETPGSLNFIIKHEGNWGDTELTELIPDTGPELEERYVSDEANAEFKGTLTPRQIQVLDLTQQGFKPKDIYQQLGYKNTGGVRYVRWAIRHKYRQFIASAPTAASAEQNS